MSAPPSSFKRLRQLFEELVELPPAARQVRLAEVANEDAELARELAAWLAADESAGGETGTFLARPVGEYAPRLVEDWLVEQEKPERLGPYRIVELLGSGGMGEVYLAERDDGQFEQQVAIKVLKLGLDSKLLVRRFFRERQILARLEHPHIARLLDGGLSSDGRPYFVMERVVGQTLTVYCQARSLDLTARLRLFVECCRAVEAAHRRLIVHRDLKPSNILVSSQDEVKVLDFGIAKLLEEGAEGEGLSRLVPGEVQAMTPAYAAPEQILGEEVSTATDVYALGVLLFEILTGAHPHRRDIRSLPELARQLERETTTKPSTALRREGLPAGPIAAHQLAGDLDAMVAKAMHREPERRYASAGALADEIERFLSGRPVEARPDSWRYRTTKFIGRHRVAVVAALLVAASLVVGLLVALSQARRAEARALEARVQAERAERVKQFVLALFREASPMQRQRETPATAEELLVAGVERARTELAAEPILQAEVLSSLASIQSNIRPGPDSLVLAEEAVAVARRAGEAAEPVLVETLASWSDLLSVEGRHGEAEKAAREAELLAARLWGLHRAETAEVSTRLVVALMHQSRYSETLEVLTRVVADLPRDREPAASSWRLQMQNLGGLLIATGRPGEGTATLTELLPALQAVQGEDHFRVGVVNINLAEGLLRDAQPERAEEAIDRALTILEKQVGREHPLYCHSQIVAGTIASARGDNPRAVALFTEASGTLHRINSPGAARAHLAAGIHYLAVEDWRGARGELEAGLGVLTRLGRGGGFLEALLATHLAYARFKDGDPDAASELENQMARLNERGSAEDEERVEPLLYLGELEASRGRMDEAKKHYQAAFDLALATYGERYPLTQEAKRRLEVDPRR